MNAFREARRNDLHPNNLLGGLVVLQVIGVVGVAVLGNIWLAMAGLWMRDAAGALAYPIRATWLNRNVDSASRATVLSIDGRADPIGQVIGGPPLGALASRTSVPTALVTSAVTLLPVAEVYRRLRRPPAGSPPRSGALRVDGPERKAAS